MQAEWRSFVLGLLVATVLFAIAALIWNLVADTVAPQFAIAVSNDRAVLIDVQTGQVWHHKLDPSDTGHAAFTFFGAKIGPAK